VDVRPLITHHIALDDVEEAMRLLQQGESGKIVIYPGGRA
jgi:threonine dehydrogenase-like Zn-dependent dehydrogenase